MKYLTQQCIRHGGKFYKSGEPIELKAADYKALPKDAVLADAQEDDIDVDGADTNVVDNARFLEAISTLADDDFKKDGEIRAASLRELNDLLGAELTVEDVKALQDQAKD